MAILVDAAVFGLTVAFIIVGIAGVVIPILPGTLLIWLSVLAYAILEGYEAIDWITFGAISLIALVTGTADLWMSLLGAQRGGASGRAFIFGFLGALAGFVVLGALVPIVGSLFGGVLGYAAGILLGHYSKHREWRPAFRASLGGVAGWGLATAVELGGGLLILLIFVWQVLRYQPA